jgi:hypothetical protein
MTTTPNTQSRRFRVRFETSYGTHHERIIEEKREPNEKGPLWSLDRVKLRIEVMLKLEGIDVRSIEIEQVS